MIEPVQVFPPTWFVENLNTGVARDWCGEGTPPYRTALDPLVIFSWYLVTQVLDQPRSLVVVSGVI